MARRKSSFFEDVFQFGRLLPWWISLLLAGGSYVLLHHYAQTEIPAVSGSNDISGPILASLIRTGSSVLKYVIPVLLLGGAILGIGERLFRRQMLRSVASDTSGDKLDSLTWVQFEDLVHQYFLERDFKVMATKEGHDGGVDFRLSKDGRRATVQCKHWRSQKVGVAIIREQFGVMTAENADQCYVVTSGEFTQEAKDWAKGKAIGLIDGEDLRHLLKVVAWDHVLTRDIGRPQAAASRNCPSCSSEMILRTARKGKNAGSRFWGCSRFPHCRGTRSLS